MHLCAVIFLAVFCGAHSELITTCSDIREFVNCHNNRRRLLGRARVANLPGATNMKYMIWDEELANKAENWASTWKMNHNSDRTVGSNRWLTGENLYWSWTAAEGATLRIENVCNAWFNEYKNYTYGPVESQADSNQTGEFTQMAWADTTHLGCAVSRFVEGNQTKFFVVCNYGPAGNSEGETPYQSGKGSTKLYCSTADDNCKNAYGTSCKYLNLLSVPTWVVRTC